MLDLDRNHGLRRLFHLARRRVVTGFGVAVVAFILATPTWTSLVTGTAIALAGQALRVWAAGHLVKGREVTISGPYRWMQHPLYVGSGLMAIGFSVIAASWIVAIGVLGYVGVMTAAAIRLEAATLREAFGDTHARYVRRRGHAGGWRPPPLQSPARCRQPRTPFGCGGDRHRRHYGAEGVVQRVTVVRSHPPRILKMRAVSSGVEHRFYTPGVTGSNPVPPTIPARRVQHPSAESSKIISPCATRAQTAAGS